MNDKQKFPVWLKPASLERVETLYKADGCQSRSIFMEKAINFYCDFLAADSSAEYLPQTIAAVVGGQIGMLGDRLGRLLFKLSVEESMMMNLIAADSDIDQETLRALRDHCVQEVRRTNGQLDFKEVLNFQKRL